jgi:predicted small integral membrane protein
MEALRLSKIVMVAGLALYALIVAFGNVTDYGSNFAFIEHVMSMDTTFPGNHLMYRAITNPVLHHAAYIAIIAGEALTGLLLARGAWGLWAARAANAAGFAAAKRPVALGVAVGFLIWFVGFLIVAGEWFAMWQSPTWNGQEAAFRIVACFLLVTIFVMQPEDRAAD